MALPSPACEVLGALLEAGDSFERTARTLALRVAESPRTVETTLRALESWSPPLVEPDPDPGIEVVAWRVTDAGRAAHADHCA
jgi:hypothetical protein